MTVSILMAARDAADTIEHAIVSVQAQTHGNWELLIVDDGSADATRDIVATAAGDDNRISLFSSAVSQGVSAARNIALSHAGGEWATILDADDSWHPHRLADMLDCAKAQGCEIVVDNLSLVDRSRGDITGTAWPVGASPRRFEVEELLRSEISLTGFRMGLLKPLFDIDFLRRSGVRYDERFGHSEDLLFLAEAMLQGARAAMTSMPGYLYTMPQGRRTKPRRDVGGDRAAVAALLRDRYAHQQPEAVAMLLHRFARTTADIRAGSMAISAVRNRAPGSIGLLCSTPLRAVLRALAATPTAKRVLGLILSRNRKA